MPLSMSRATAAMRRQRYCSQVTMSKIEHTLKEEKYYEQRKADLETNKNKLEKLIIAFNKEFSEDQDIIAFFQNYFNAWAKRKYKRNYEWAVIKIKTMLTNISDDVVTRFENVVARVEQEIEQEDEKARKSAEREAFKKQYIAMREAKKNE